MECYYRIHISLGEIFLNNLYLQMALLMREAEAEHRLKHMNKTKTSKNPASYYEEVRHYCDLV